MLILPPRGKSLCAASVKQLFRCITLHYRGVGKVHEGETRTWRSREPLERAAGPIEMQRVHEKANARPAGCIHDADRGIDVWHDRPRKESSTA